MKRPDTGVDSLKWRLDKILLRKADEGVCVYILLGNQDFGIFFSQQRFEQGKICSQLSGLECLWRKGSGSAIGGRLQRDNPTKLPFIMLTLMP